MDILTKDDKLFGVLHHLSAAIFHHQSNFSIAFEIYFLLTRCVQSPSYQKPRLELFSLVYQPNFLVSSFHLNLLRLLKFNSCTFTLTISGDLVFPLTIRFFVLSAVQAFLEAAVLRLLNASYPIEQLLNQLTKLKDTLQSPLAAESFQQGKQLLLEELSEYFRYCE